MIRSQQEEKSLILSLEGLDDTRVLGREIAAALRPGMALLLDGELGAGKTTLVREICRSLGWKRTCSPSFSLVNEYAGARIPVAHADLYRIELADARDFGLDEYLDDGWVLIVEWPDRLARIDFPELWRCRIERGEGESRRISITALGKIAVNSLEHLENSFE